jgi:tetratricopeptide (TPR) repeat protein
MVPSPPGHRPCLRARIRSLAAAAGVTSVLLGLALLPNEASGQKSARPSSSSSQPDAGERHDPDNVTAISQFMETVVKGTSRYDAKDYPGAVDLYKKAIALNPRHPLGSYLIGEAYLASGNLGEAEAAFKTAEDLTDPKFAVVRSHVLFAVADVYERQKKWEQARAAWQAYSEHAAKLGSDDAGPRAHPQSGAARLKAVDEWLKLDKQYELVRQRIAAEKAAAADASAPSKR